MATRKATEEFFQAKGLSRAAVIERIKDGRIKGEVDSKSIMIDESEWPEHLQFKPKEDVTEASITRQNLLDETERLKAEKLKIDAETQLAIAKGVLERPEKLDKREKEIEAKESDLIKRLKECELKETEQHQREILLVENEKQIQTRKELVDKECSEKLEAVKNECEQLLNETANLIESKNNDFDIEQIAKQNELDKIQGQINKKRVELDGLLDAISGYENAIAPFVKELQSLGALARKTAERNYHYGQRSKDKVADYYYNRAKRGWDLETKIKNFLKTLVR